MKIKIGVMGSAEEAPGVLAKAEELGQAIAAHHAILFTGATTGLIYAVGKAARAAGAMHLGISPAHDQSEHVEKYRLPVDACDAIIYTGFGLKGRNVVLVRSCDIVIFIAGAIGSLNEFTIAYDEGKIIGCLTGTGGVADEIERIVVTLNKPTNALVSKNNDPAKLLEVCLEKLENRDM